VLESVLLPPSLLPLTDYLHSHSSPLLDLLSTAGLTDTFSNLSNATLFLPSLSALSHYGETEMEIEKERLAEILLHHVVRDQEQKEGRGHSLDTAAGTRLRLSRHHHWGQGPVTTVQCARITGPESQVCGGRIVPIDRMLTPPEGDVMHTLERDHKEFAKLIKVAELDLDLSSGQYTVLAPVDSAFASLPEQTRNSMYSDPAMARMVVKSHLLRDPVCCAAIPRVSRMAVHTIQGNRLMLARNYGGRIYADRAAVVRCDQSAHNGVVHSISRVLGHSPNSRTRGAHSQGAYNILAQPWLF